MTEIKGGRGSKFRGILPATAPYVASQWVRLSTTSLELILYSLSVFPIFTKCGLYSVE